MQQLHRKTKLTVEWQSPVFGLIVRVDFALEIGSISWAN